MRVYPKPLEIGDHEGFSTDKDLFGKSDLAKGMSHLVATVEDPLVIAFDGQWGSGKTTFLKMWAGELRKSGHPVIFFDAFENDYVEDAFAALAREIIELAEEKASPQGKVVQEIREKASELGVMLLKGAAKVGAKVIVRAATAGLASTDDLKDVANDIREEVGSTAEAYMDQLLDQPRKQKQTAQIFREALANIPSLLASPTGAEPQKPMIFIIDELDRCKPFFALALLERIKHFMSVPNVHFVLGVHLAQLQTSVEYAYGNNINSIAYLQKFINLTISNTDKIDSGQNINLKLYAKHLIKNLEIQRNHDSPLEKSVETILRVIQYEQMSYRTLERAFTILALAIGLTPENRLQLGAIIGGLVMMKLLRPDLYKKAKQGTLDLEETRHFLRLDVASNPSRQERWEDDWWTYSLSTVLPERLNNFGESVIFRYSFDNRSEIVMYTANEVIDRLSPT